MITIDVNKKVDERVLQVELAAQAIKLGIAPTRETFDELAAMVTTVANAENLLDVRFEVICESLMGRALVAYFSLEGADLDDRRDAVGSYADATGGWYSEGYLVENLYSLRGVCTQLRVLLDREWVHSPETMMVRLNELINRCLIALFAIEHGRLNSQVIAAHLR